MFILSPPLVPPNAKTGEVITVPARGVALNQPVMTLKNLKTRMSSGIAVLPAGTHHHIQHNLETSDAK